MVFLLSAWHCSNIFYSCNVLWFKLSSFHKKYKHFQQPGITTNEINSIVHDETIKLGAFPSPLGYRGFPKSCCTSVNHVCCHGIPDDTELRDGDVINVDVSVFHRGYHGDTSDTFPVGNVDPVGELLIATARDCLQAAIECCGHGRLLSEIGSRVQVLADERGFTVSKKFVGHGIGRHFHCLPQVRHYVNQSEERMSEGMVMTVEPIVMEGRNESRATEDGWTEVSVDGLRSSQAEHTLVVTKDSCLVLTWNVKFCKYLFKEIYYCLFSQSFNFLFMVIFSYKFFKYKFY